MSGQICPFHADEWFRGERLDDGSFSYTCDRQAGHPGDRQWSWLEVPEPPSTGLSGLAEELNLEEELPAALAALGQGWFEYGLVERSYALRQPEGFARAVGQWGHTAIAKTQYSASSYLAGTLGHLSRRASVAYHGGPGTGRWSYNAGISWWSTLPAVDWTSRTAWVDVFGDRSREDQEQDVVCRAYVPGARPIETS